MPISPRSAKAAALISSAPLLRPSALLGDKAKAKATAKSVKCPIIPGSDGVVEDVKEALNEAKKIGFPIFIKAVAGGGGKGIRIAYDPEEFVRQFAAARAEAEVKFQQSRRLSRKNDRQSAPYRDADHR